MHSALILCLPYSDYLLPQGMSSATCPLPFGKSWFNENYRGRKAPIGSSLHGEQTGRLKGYVCTKVHTLSPRPCTRELCELLPHSCSPRASPKCILFPPPHHQGRPRGWQELGHAGEQTQVQIHVHGALCGWMELEVERKRRWAMGQMAFQPEHREVQEC